MKKQMLDEGEYNFQSGFSLQVNCDIQLTLLNLKKSNWAQESFNDVDVKVLFVFIPKLIKERITWIYFNTLKLTLIVDSN